MSKSHKVKKELLLVSYMIRVVFSFQVLDVETLTHNSNVCTASWCSVTSVLESASSPVSISYNMDSCSCNFWQRTWLKKAVRKLPFGIV